MPAKNAGQGERCEKGRKCKRTSHHHRIRNKIQERKQQKKRQDAVIPAPSKIVPQVFKCTFDLGECPLAQMTDECIHCHLSKQGSPKGANSIVLQPLHPPQLAPNGDPAMPSVDDEEDESDEQDTLSDSVESDPEDDLDEDAWTDAALDDDSDPSPAVGQIPVQTPPVDGFVPLPPPQQQPVAAVPANPPPDPAPADPPAAQSPPDPVPAPAQPPVSAAALLPPAAPAVDPTPPPPIAPNPPVQAPQADPPQQAEVDDLKDVKVKEKASQRVQMPWRARVKEGVSKAARTIWTRLSTVQKPLIPEAIDHLEAIQTQPSGCDELSDETQWSRQPIKHCHGYEKLQERHAHDRAELKHNVNRLKNLDDDDEDDEVRAVKTAIKRLEKNLEKSETDELNLRTVKARLYVYTGSGLRQERDHATMFQRMEESVTAAIKDLSIKVGWAYFRTTATQGHELTEQTKFVTVTNEERNPRSWITCGPKTHHEGKYCKRWLNNVERFYDAVTEVEVCPMLLEALHSNPLSKSQPANALCTPKQVNDTLYAVLKYDAAQGLKGGEHLSNAQLELLRGYHNVDILRDSLMYYYQRRLISDAAATDSRPRTFV